MATESMDWYPGNRAKQRVMYQNVRAKIDGYEVKYDLAAAALAEVQVICETFLHIDDKFNQNGDGKADDRVARACH